MMTKATAFEVDFRKVEFEVGIDRLGAMMRAIEIDP